ncbi:MOSC domain-containing protein [Luedemannella flava]|uniref:MOSC domain-containing protein n=1 Tax=Luedemannella flava TaxID=349316 RepID=A0ABN2LPA0_9ACTN
MPSLLSVNVSVPRPDPGGDVGTTGIDRRPVDHPVHVRAPGPKLGGLGSGLVGDEIFSRRHHGGDDQAVYAYAREDLDWWEAELGHPLPSGVFGENATTRGLDVTGALIGERWAIGDEVLLEIADVRIPCSTFARWIEEEHWVKRFTVAARPGAYLRVITPGEIRGGDPVTVVSRPDHDVTVGVVFRALTREPELLPRLLDVPQLAQSTRDHAARRVHAT